MNHKTAHTISNDDLKVAMDEMKSAMNDVVESAGHMLKSVDWKTMAPRIAAGLMLLYSIRNRKMQGVITSLVVAGVSNYISHRMEDKQG